MGAVKVRGDDETDNAVAGRPYWAVDLTAGFTTREGADVGTLVST